MKVPGGAVGYCLEGDRSTHSTLMGTTFPSPLAKLPRGEKATGEV